MRKLSKNYQKTIKKLSKNYQKTIKKLSKNYSITMKKLFNKYEKKAPLFDLKNYEMTQHACVTV